MPSSLPRLTAPLLILSLSLSALFAPAALARQRAAEPPGADEAEEATTATEAEPTDADSADQDTTQAATATEAEEATTATEAKPTDADSADQDTTQAAAATEAEAPTNADSADQDTTQAATATEAEEAATATEAEEPTADRDITQMSAGSVLDGDPRGPRPASSEERPDVDATSAQKSRGYVSPLDAELPPGPMNVVSAGLLGLGFGQYQLEYERILDPGMGVAFSFAYTRAHSLAPFGQYIGEPFNEQMLNVEGYAVGAALRIYPYDTAPGGFFIGPVMSAGWEILEVEIGSSRAPRVTIGLLGGYAWLLADVIHLAFGFGGQAGYGGVAVNSGEGPAHGEFNGSPLIRLSAGVMF